MSPVQYEAESNAGGGEVLTGVLKHLSLVQDEAEGNARGGEVLTGVLRDPSQRDSYAARQARAQSGSLLALL